MAEVSAAVDEDIIKMVQKLLQNLSADGLHITAAYLYGSHVSGTAHKDSDIDVAIVSTDLSGDRIADWCRLNIVASYIDTRLEVIGFRPEQFRDEHPLAWEVKTKGLRLRLFLPKN